MKDKYNSTYNDYMPWVEDKVLGYWGENKTSYTAKGQSFLPCLFPYPAILANVLPTDKLSTDITGDKNINAVQSGVAEGVGGTLSSGGILGGVGDATSKEGVNRAERGDLDPTKQAELEKKKQQGWVEWGSMGYLGGGGKK